PPAPPRPAGRARRVLPAGAPPPLRAAGGLAPAPRPCPLLAWRPLRLIWSHHSHEASTADRIRGTRECTTSPYRSCPARRDVFRGERLRPRERSLVSRRPSLFDALRSEERRVGEGR